VKLLALDTSTEQCSAALLQGTASEVGAVQIATREALQPRMHGALILPMIDQLLAQAGLRLSGLDAIAFGRGPGAFTGVRLAAGIAQGLGHAAGLPLLPVSDLRAVAAQALWLPEAPARVLVCQDARMEEVYWGGFERHGQRVVASGPEAVGPPATVRLPASWEAQGWAAIWGVGTGFGQYADFAGTPARRLPEVRAHAREIALLALVDGLAAAVAPEAAEPVYLRDQVATPRSTP